MSQVRNTSGLKPFKPGDVGNPEGRNQYTYRQNFERSIERLLAGKFEFRREVVEDREGEKVACLICGLRNCDIYVGEQQYAHDACAQGLDGMTRGEAIAYVTVRRAMQGDEKMLPVVLDRLWPKLSRHELEAHVSGEIEIVGEAEWSELAGRADRLKSNGKEVPQRGGNGADAPGDSS